MRTRDLKATIWRHTGLAVVLLFFAGGLLQKAQVFDVDAGVAMIWVFPLLCAIYGIAKMILTRRYL